jgi:hypothetical protein
MHSDARLPSTGSSFSTRGGLLRTLGREDIGREDYWTGRLLAVSQEPLSFWHVAISAVSVVDHGSSMQQMTIILMLKFLSHFDLSL